MIFDIQRFGGTTGREYSPQNAASSAFQSQQLNNQAAPLMQNSMGATQVQSSPARGSGGKTSGGTPAQSYQSASNRNYYSQPSYNSSAQNYSPYGGYSAQNYSPYGGYSAQSVRTPAPTTSAEAGLMGMQQQSTNAIQPQMQALNNQAALLLNNAGGRR